MRKWLHNNTCGDFTLAFRFYTWFASECPCCSFYRGVFLGAAIVNMIWLMA